MLDIREILCPTDFSEPSRDALAHAVVIGRWYGARITALHVIQVPLFTQSTVVAAGLGNVPRAIMPNHLAVEQRLQVFLDAAQQAGLETDVSVDDGNAARQILDHARSRRTDLIVMGTHGLSGFERFMLGSVTEKVLRQATCPVMTVPPAVHTPAKVPYTRLLCPVDFSEPSLAAFRFALSLAEEANAHLTLLHVFDWPADDDLLVERFDTPEFRRAVEDQAKRRLEALVTDDVRQWCNPSTAVAYGKPYSQILETAVRENTDLIVMGVRGRNPVDLTLFGSTANHVVRRASCPVLSLRQ